MISIILAKKSEGFGSDDIKNRYEGYAGKKYDDEPKKGNWAIKASEEDKYKDTVSILK